MVDISFIRARRRRGGKRMGYSSELRRIERVKAAASPIISRLLDNDDGIIATPSNSSLLDNDIVIFEILSRLPVKSLMRFKCVCKRWMFLIQQDPHFHDLHLTLSEKERPGLLILVPLRRMRAMRHQKRGGALLKFRDLQECFLSANLLFEGRAVEAAFHTDIKTTMNSNSIFYNEILKPVNGLICFINSGVFLVSICNLCTREVTPWIESTLLMKVTEEHDGVHLHHQLPTYGFGYDPATKEHKLISVWRISNITVCEVLTVGHNSWRRIDEVPPYDIVGDYVYANGSIYWGNNKLFNDEWDDDDPEVIMAFDVGSEKFRVIPIPIFILDQPRVNDKYFGPPLALLELDGCVALLYRMNGYIVKLWKFDDDYDKENSCTTPSASNRNWTEETIKLPFCWDEYRLVYFHAVAGTHQIIIESYRDFRKAYINSVSLHSYNRKKKTFEKVGISGISSSWGSFRDFYCSSLFTTFVESLLPVQMNQQRHNTKPPLGK